MTNPIEDIRARLDGGRKWCKGKGWDGDKICLVEAVAAKGHAGLLYLLGGVIQERHPHRARGSIVAFNDHPDTTYADIDAVLDEMSQRWEETYGGAA